MPSKKRKQTGKKKIQSKRKAVTREKKITKVKQIKTIDNMNLAELRVLATRFGVKSGGIRKPVLKQRIKKAMQSVEPSKYFENFEGGSITNVTFDEDDYSIDIIDKDIEPHKKVKIDRMSEGVYAINQETFLGEPETIILMVRDNPMSIEQKKKALKEPMIVPKPKFPSGNAGVKSDKFSQLHEKRLLPTLPGLVKSGQSVAEKKEQNRLLNVYKKRHWIPFYYPSNAKRLINPKMFEKVKEVDYLVEKDQLLKDVKNVVTVKEFEQKLASASKARKKAKGKQKKPKTITQIKKESNVYVTQTGQHIQTQAFETDENIGFDWVGLFYQQGSKATKYNPIPSIVRVRKQIRADNDDAGHFIAYINNLYAYGDPLRKNFKVVGQSIKPADSFRAMRFLAKSIVNTLGVKRNLGIQDAIMKDMGGKALKFRKTKGGMDNLVISEQIIEIVKKAQNREIIVTVQTPDRKPINFKAEFKKWNEKKPSLKFVETDKSYHPLDSDTLLRVIVRKFSIDSISGQRLLETLHNQEWITYPRIDVQKAEDEPIKIMNDKKRRELKAIVEGKSSKEQLTVQEFEILKIIYDSEKFSDKKENFVKRGHWKLKSGDLILKTDDVILASEEQSYTPKLFDIDIHKRTVNEDEMLQFLIDENIGTPATRTAQLERLRGSGVLAVKEENYVIDRRGYYMVAGHKVFEEEKINLTKDLLFMLNNVQDNDFEGLNQIVNSFQLIDRNTLAKKTKKQAKVLIEAEHDLTYLDSF